MAHPRALAVLSRRKPGGQDFQYAASGIHTEGRGARWQPSKKQGKAGKAGKAKKKKETS